MQQKQFQTKAKISSKNFASNKSDSTHSNHLPMWCSCCQRVGEKKRNFEKNEPFVIASLSQYLAQTEIAVTKVLETPEFPVSKKNASDDEMTKKKQESFLCTKIHLSRQKSTSTNLMKFDNGTFISCPTYLLSKTKQWR